MKQITEYDHPEHCWKWTQMEIEWITERIKAERADERARCIFECMRGDYEYKTAMECVADIRRMNDA